MIAALKKDETPASSVRLFPPNQWNTAKEAIETKNEYYKKKNEWI